MKAKECATTNIKLPKEEFEILKKEASKQKKSVSFLAQKLIQDYFKKQTKIPIDTKIKKEKVKKVTEKDVLRWSREAKKLKKEGKLPLFKDLIKKEYPLLAKKYNL